MKKLLPILLFMFTLPHVGNGQETVFGIFKKDGKLADEYFKERRFNEALELYKSQTTGRHPAQDVHLKIARCYYFLKNYPKAIASYRLFQNQSGKLPEKDFFYLAEAQLTTRHDTEAIQAYQDYLKSSPEDAIVMQKIWRLNNKSYLFEDSVHFAVRPLDLNTVAGEFCARPYKNGLIFLSNRKEIEVVKKVDASSNQPFYRMYYAPFKPDTSDLEKTVTFSRSKLISKELGVPYHIGPVDIYGDGKKMIFASTSDTNGPDGQKTLQLFFAEEENGHWKVTTSFPFNSLEYSITDPSITEDGTRLYFSSDMKGGHGEKDLYVSALIGGKWSQPANLGDQINTPYDEVFPFLHTGNTLYFSSNGHAGLGGLDIFKVIGGGTVHMEVLNMGFPINSPQDDFGIYIDSLELHGYFSSNRKNGGYDDDLFEFDMDLQTYPLDISGTIRFKEYAWSDSADITIMPRAKIHLIDNIRNITVSECQSGDDGSFNLRVPWFSKFRIRVVGEEKDEHVVSLEIPRHRKLLSNHDIVVVKDAFQTPTPKPQEE
jgi:hypothetical protein